MLIIIDPGHGGIDGGAGSPAGALEKDQVLSISLLIKKMEPGFGGKVSFTLTRTSDVYLSLETRAAICNQATADYFISIHQNSDDAGRGKGVETYILAPGGKREELARSIQAQMVAGTGLADRGIKIANYYVLKHTNPPAMLVECGFIGTASEAAIVTTPGFHEKAALSICRGIAFSLGIPFTWTKPLYRVRKTWEDVKSQLGAFYDLNKAKEVADRYKAEGYRVFDETGEVVYTPAASNPVPPPNPIPAPAPVIAKDSIMGNSKATAKQMAHYLLVNNRRPVLDGMAPIQFCQLYLDEGAAEGIRGDIAYCQSLKETNWYKFEKDVKPEQHNYAGIGATGDGVPGASFPDQRAGIRAQIQHLKAYACTESLKNPVVDPRFGLVTRGSAPNWQDLAGKWSAPGYDTGKYPSLEEALIAGETYGQEIMKLYKALLQTKEPVDPAAAAIDELKRLGLLDHDVQPGQAVTWGELAQLVVKLKE